ncbi:anthrax toxin receptor-like [Eulemur rufifrons]|uniref:anthrax toxin receptor-like n=1 Tax=Eulemur rufifrons TaxID=859984 RepID=UPI003741FF3F
MGSRGVRGPCSALFLLLLLLLLPPPLFRAGSFRHPRPDWRMFHHLGPGSRRAHHRHSPGTRHHWRQGQAQPFCKAKFDLYYVIDKSGSVNNNWVYLYKFVEATAKRLQNQNVRLSFITYSNHGETVMLLTSDSEYIRRGLEKLRKVVPEGHSFMQEGLKRANEQMLSANLRVSPPAHLHPTTVSHMVQKAVQGAADPCPSTVELLLLSGGRRLLQKVSGPCPEDELRGAPGHVLKSQVSSMVIAITDGPLVEQAFQETLRQADKARKQGANIYTVGVADFSKQQITAIADSKAHVFAVNNGFKGLRSIVEPLTKSICVAVISVEPSAACAGESYEVVVHGTGFQNTRGQDQVICRFKFGDDNVVDEKPISMDKTSITCPGPKIEEPGEKVSVEVSLDNGNIFHSSEEASYTTTSCVSRFWYRLIPALLLPLLCGLCYLCFRKIKKPRPKQKSEKQREPEKQPPPPPPPGPPPPPRPPPPPPRPPPPVCPTVIDCCSTCQRLCRVYRIRGLEGTRPPKQGTVLSSAFRSYAP